MRLNSCRQKTTETISKPSTDAISIETKKLPARVLPQESALYWIASLLPVQAEAYSMVLLEFFRTTLGGRQAYWELNVSRNA
ncbi:hypothetical protein [Aurantivibrio infirmus]